MTDSERVAFIVDALTEGEVEFGFDAAYDMYFGFSWLSGYVLASSASAVIDAMHDEYVFCGCRKMRKHDIILPDKFISWCKRHGVKHLETKQHSE